MKYLLMALLAGWMLPLGAQSLSMGDYRKAVTEYSHTLRIAREESRRAAQIHARIRRGLLPRLDLKGSFSASIHHFEGRKHWTFALEPQIVQTLFGGGVRVASESSELEYEATLDESEFSRREVVYAADYAYLNLSAMGEFLRSMRRYVEIIGSLKKIVDRRFAEGYIARGDVLMIDTRLSEAEYDALTAEENYAVACHNFNILMGGRPDDPISLADGIKDRAPLPARVALEEALDRRHDLRAMILRARQAEIGVRVARTPYNPRLEVGFGGAWQPMTINRTGETYLDGVAFVQLHVPIFHWGERRRAVGAARAVQRQSEERVWQLRDDITREEADAWSRLVETRAKIDTSIESLRIAGENLEISTYSYSEGQATVLDVLQAQLSWIRLYTNAISAHYAYALARSSYERITSR